MAVKASASLKAARTLQPSSTPSGTAPRAMICALSAGMLNLRTNSRVVSEAVGASTGSRMNRDSSRPLVICRSFPIVRGREHGVARRQHVEEGEHFAHRGAARLVELVDALDRPRGKQIPIAAALAPLADEVHTEALAIHGLDRKRRARELERKLIGEACLANTGVAIEQHGGAIALCHQGPRRRQDGSGGPEEALRDLCCGCAV
jgi:hypothetical protein